MSCSVHKPHPLLDPVVPGILAQAMVAAVEVGLPEALLSGPLTAEAIACEHDLDAATVARLADVLVACGYLERCSQGYALSEVGRASLLPGGDFCLVNWIRFCRFQLAVAARLPRVLAGEGPVDLFEMMQEPGDLLIHQRAMAETARPAAGWLATQIPVTGGATAMLDVGGSHGLYSAAVCKSNPGMRADVLELPSMIDSARQVAIEYGTDECCTHIAGDVVTDALPGRYDVILLGNMLHHFDEERARALVRKLAGHLNRGGTLAIWDLVPAADDRDLAAACFSLFFQMTSGARCHSGPVVAGLLKEAGLNQVVVAVPPGVSTHACVTARRQE